MKQLTLMFAAAVTQGANLDQVEAQEVIREERQTMVIQLRQSMQDIIEWADTIAEWLTVKIVPGWAEESSWFCSSTLRVRPAWPQSFCAAWRWRYDWGERMRVVPATPSSGVRSET